MEKTEKVIEKHLENHGIFCNLKSTNPVELNLGHSNERPKL